MGNFCRKEGADCAQLSNQAFQGSTMEWKPQQPSNSLKLSLSHHVSQSSTHNKTYGKQCAKCEYMITEGFCQLDDFHVYHETCLRDIITSQLQRGLQQFKCGVCPLTFGAQMIKNLNIQLPSDYYYCRSCQDNCLYIDPNNSEMNVICEKCNRSTIFIPFKQ